MKKPTRDVKSVLETAKSHGTTARQPGNRRRKRRLRMIPSVAHIEGPSDRLTSETLPYALRTHPLGAAFQSVSGL